LGRADQAGVVGGDDELGALRASSFMSRRPTWVVAVVARRTGFTTTVDAPDLREGGELAYTMTATAPETIEFARAPHRAANLRQRFLLRR
jgi:hypothetical protein